MRRPIKYGMLWIICMSINQVSAQRINDTVVQMKTVDIESQKGVAIADGYVSIKCNDMKLDGEYQAGKRVSDVLGENTSVFIKNYGVGQLSSISINGSSAGQTTILWNGIKLNSPATGQTDLALFDMGTIDDIKVTNTASNQSIGGTVALNNSPMFDKDTIISRNVIRYGSFSTLNLSSDNIYSLGIFSGSTKVNYIRSDNDFPFVNNTQIGLPVQKESNAAISLLSFLQQLDVKIKKYNVGAMFWVTDADRQLPPTMAEPVGYEHEWDKSYRAMAYLTGRKGLFNFSLKTSYLYDWLKYTDPLAAIDSRSSGQATRNLFTGSYVYVNRLFIDGTINYDHEGVVSTGFNSAYGRDISGLNISVAYRWGAISRVGISVKEELLDAKPLPFSPGAFMNFSTVKRGHAIVVTISGARSYRVPALNDLYWDQGGNPNLRPEHAWNSSLNLEYGFRHFVRFSVNGFYNYVTDWILWHPAPNSSFWTADNVKRVVSRGLNLGMTLKNKPIAERGFVVVLYTSYSYTNTISLDAVSGNDDSRDKQLIYVPLHNFNASLQLQYRRFYIRSINSYTGVRYTATDDSQVLPGYYLSHLELGKDFYFNNQQIGLSFRINNITNCQYQVVTQRAMPGRSYEMTVRLNLAK